MTFALKCGTLLPATRVPSVRVPGREPGRDLVWSVERRESPGIRWVDCYEVNSVDGGDAVNRAQRRRRSGCLFAMWTDEGLIVRRLRKDPGGGWLLVSDHADRELRPWSESAEILGRVRWATRTFD